VEDILFYPWGQDTWHLWGSGGYNFAGMPYYDTNTNTNPTMFRFYSQNLGRWHSPDPMGGDITNPQSLNRYAYVLNNPTSLTDPLGLCGEHYTTVEWDSEGNVIDWWEDEGDPCLPEEQSQSNHDPYGLAYLPLGSGWGWGAGGGAGSGGANIIYWSQLQPLVHQNNHSGECDELIDCIVRIESSAPGGYDANALGTPFTPRGGGPQQQARGLMQVTQGAASTVVNAYGIATSGDALYKLLFNPSINISAGSYYLQYLKGRTGGDLLKALNRYGGSSSGGYADAIHDCVEQLKQGNLGRAEGAAHGHQ
jgi:RHS repeat-associated protein